MKTNEQATFAEGTLTVPAGGGPVWVNIGGMTLQITAEAGTTGATVDAWRADAPDEEEPWTAEFDGSSNRVLLSEKARQFAKIEWKVEDIQERRPGWSDERCRRFLNEEADGIQAAMIEAGANRIAYCLRGE